MLRILLHKDNELLQRKSFNIFIHISSLFYFLIFIFQFLIILFEIIQKIREY